MILCYTLVVVDTLRFSMEGNVERHILYRCVRCTCDCKAWTSSFAHDKNPILLKSVSGIEEGMNVYGQITSGNLLGTKVRLVVCS